MTHNHYDFKETRVHKTVLSQSCGKFYPHAKQCYANNFTVLIIQDMSVNLATFDFLKLKIHTQVIHLFSKNYILINTGIFIEKTHTQKINKVQCYAPL